MSKSNIYLVIDLEATCWQKGSEKGRVNEIIEIGLVILGADKERLWSGFWFVRPKLHPILSDFCIELTTITQEQVDNGADFITAMKALEQVVLQVSGVSVKECLFISWGNYDRKQFEHDCNLHGYHYPFGTHLNLKREFMRKHGLKRAGMKFAMEKLGLEMKGTPHRGIDDALNLVEVFRAMA